MRAVQLALLLLSIQLGLGLVATFGGFGNIPYNPEMTGINIPSSPVQTETEQQQQSFNIMDAIFNILTWGWIREFFVPWYYQDMGVKSIVDFITYSLTTLSSIIIGVAFIEFVRNRIVL